MPCVKCTGVTNAEDLHKSGVWIKARIYEQGNFMVADVYSVADGVPKVATIRVSLPAIQRFLNTQTNQVSGCGWNPVCHTTKTVKKVARHKIVKRVYSTARNVVKVSSRGVKSKALGVGLGALAAFPPTAPVGAPALVAYVAANAYLATAARGVKAARKIEKKLQSVAQYRKLKRSLLSLGASRARSMARNNPRVRKALIKGRRVEKKATRFFRGPGYSAAMSRMAAARKAKAALKRVAAATRSQNEVKRRNALKTQAVLRVVAANRARLRRIALANSAGLPGLLIDHRGRINKGRFIRQGTAASGERLYRSGYSTPGTFQRV